MTRIAAAIAFVAAMLFCSLPAASAQPTNPVSVQPKPAPTFLTGSLGELIYTNFIAHTNGRSMEIWQTYLLPPKFPAGYFPPDQLPFETRPILAWNTNCLLWGMKGQTALSQCWTAQGARGQVPVTAFTRRHGYARGHSMGNAGMTDHFNGQRVYFCTLNNEVVEAIVQNAVVEIGKGFDFTILLFSKDLPLGIQPMRVADMKSVFEKYPPSPTGTLLQFQTEQGGYVSAGHPPFICNTWKGGDSGSPNLLPLPGELIFYSGRSTSGPSPQMQADMDELSRHAGLDPAKYQLQWLNLSAFLTPK